MAHPIFVPALFLPCIKQVHGAVQIQALHLLFKCRTDRRLILTFTALGRVGDYYHAWLAVVAQLAIYIIRDTRECDLYGTYETCD